MKILEILNTRNDAVTQFEKKNHNVLTWRNKEEKGLEYSFICKQEKNCFQIKSKTRKKMQQWVILKEIEKKYFFY